MTKSQIPNTKEFPRTVTSKKVPPPEHTFYGDAWVRGLDPWHRDAFPSELANRAPNQGERGGGWFLEDAWGNAIAFVPDGTVCRC